MRWEVLEEIGGERTHSRVSARAVLAGAAVGLAVFGVLSELVGAFGFYPSGVLDAQAAETMMRGVGLWSIAWLASVLVAGFVASTTARAATFRDGLINGFVTWAVAYLAVGVLFWAGFLVAVRLDLASPEFLRAMLGRDVFLGGFLYDVAAAFCGGLGGLLGARTEAREHRVRVRHMRPTVPHAP